VGIINTKPHCCFQLQIFLFNSLEFLAIIKFFVWRIATFREVHSISKNEGLLKELWLEIKQGTLAYLRHNSN